eukprot:2838951-Pyramimonas_sp.AAC.1
MQNANGLCVSAQGLRGIITSYISYISYSQPKLKPREETKRERGERECATHRKREGRDGAEWWKRMICLPREADSRQVVALVWNVPSPIPHTHPQWHHLAQCATRSTIKLLLDISFTLVHSRSLSFTVYEHAYPTERRRVEGITHCVTSLRAQRGKAVRGYSVELAGTFQT